MRYLLFLLIAFELSGCKTKQQAQVANFPLEMAKQKLGASVDSFPNSTGRYILYVQQQDANNPTRMTSAIVIEVKNNRIIAEESFSPGYIKWTDESTLELLSVPEVIKSGEDLSLYIRKISLVSINKSK